MPRRSLHEPLRLGTLATCLLLGCEDKPGDAAADAGAAKASAESVDTLNARCEQLGKACGEKEKHQAIITDECKQAAKKQAEKACTSAAVAAYDCYEKEICASIKKIWALDDFRVLTERHEKCLDLRKATITCESK
jgi:hypothetical protein